MICRHLLNYFFTLVENIKLEHQYLESFEMWRWKRMEKIIWSEELTNKEVFERIEEKRKPLNNILWRKTNWIGHILRRD